MAFSKIAGLEVTPRSESSSTSRCSSPDSIRLRRIWSSQTAVPASVSAASRSFCWEVTAISLLVSFVDSVPGGGALALQRCLGSLCHVLRGEAEVGVEVLGRGRRAEAVHADRLAVLGHPALLSKGSSGLHRHPCAAGGREDAVAVALVLLEEAVEAGHAHHAGCHAVRTQDLGRLQAQAHLRAGPDQDHVEVAVAAVAQYVGAPVDRVSRD